jgi:hypothetical protein
MLINLVPKASIDKDKIKENEKSNLKRKRSDSLDKEEKLNEITLKKQ